MKSTHIFLIYLLIILFSIFFTSSFETLYDSSLFNNRNIREVTISDIGKIIQISNLTDNNFVSTIKGEEYVIDNVVYRTDIKCSKLTVIVRAYKNLYICNMAEKECIGGLSAINKDGLQTRCYLDINKTSWINCATGWKT